MPFWLEIIINVVFSYVASVGFALIINVPHRDLNFSGISGVVGWMAYWFCLRWGLGRMASNLIGAFLIGILGLFFARIKKKPSYCLQHSSLSAFSSRCTCLPSCSGLSCW